MLIPAVISGGGSAESKPFNSESYLEGISNRLGTKVKVLYGVDVPPLDEVFENSEFVTTPGGESGLKGEYFSNEELKGSPALVRTDKHVHFDWGEGSFAPGEPVDHFSVRWTGYFVPKESGDYTVLFLRGRRGSALRWRRDCDRRLATAFPDVGHATPSSWRRARLTKSVSNTSMPWAAPSLASA